MTETTYDVVAYPSHAFGQTHPLRLALPAALLGLPFPAAETARILEIGCGEGGNIIPLAVAYPKATIVGFDLASTAIAAGAAVVAALGLTNIRLETRDILEVGADFGQFDYIIAHGVYSWVPDAVRDGVLRILQDCLSPEGLAFVSYNALPGGYLRLAARDMLLRHLRGVSDPAERIAKSRAFLQMYVAQAPDDDAFPAAMKIQCRAMLERTPEVLFHDELGEIFQPFYVHEFIGAAEGRGLHFLSEAGGHWWREVLFPSSRGQAVSVLIGDDDRTKRLEYLDYITGQAFQQAILCRAGRAEGRQVDLHRIRQLWVDAPAKAETETPDLESTTPLRFQLARSAIRLEHPGLKQALYKIGQAWPGPMAVADLPDDPDVDEGLMQLFTAGHLDLMVASPPFNATASDYPRASPLALLGLSQGRKALVSLDHSMVPFEDEEGRAFLAMLDGTHSHADLATAISQDGDEPAKVKARVEQQLQRLARLGLLVA